MERDFIEHLTATAQTHPRLKLGIGDDAAVFDFSAGGDCVIATDTISDGIDFRSAEVEPERIGRKALAVNLSDLAAMAATPVAAVAAITAPKSCPLAYLQRLMAGMQPLAEQFDCPIAGGDFGLAQGPLTITVTVVGDMRGRPPLTRSAAQPGDAILVTGRLGGSLLGRHLDFIPRVWEALRLVDDYEIHAGLDLSDGLALDLDRLCRASGVGATIDAAGVPVSPAAHEMARQGGGLKTPLDHALSDGEDFELLLTAPWEVGQRLAEERPLRPTWISVIGRVESQPGLRLAVEGRVRELKPAGWLHGGDVTR